MIRQETLLLLQEYQIDYTVSKASQIPIRSQTKQRNLPILKSKRNQIRKFVEAARTKQDHDSRPADPSSSKNKSRESRL
jgi:hypothetical protein